MQGKRYLEQLRTDNKSLIGEYTIQRIDGTNFTYQFRNNEGKKTFSVKVSFFVNEKKKCFIYNFFTSKEIRYYGKETKNALLRRRDFGCSQKMQILW